MANDLDLALRIQADVNEALRELRAVRREIGDVGRRADRTGDDLGDMGNRADRVGAQFGALKNILLGVGAALAVRQVIDAGLAYERIERGLKAATGSAAAARRELDFVRETVERLGLDLRTTAQQYTSLAAAARGTALEGEQTREVFIAISEASTALGLTADQTGGALTAIQQIISKGVVSAEELRQQLGERLPGAFQAAAKAMGVTTAELDKMLATGKLTAEEFLPRLAAQLRSTYGQTAVDSADSAQAAINRFQSALFELNAQVARGGFLDAMTDALEEVTELISNPAIAQGLALFAATVARAFAAAAGQIAKVAEGVGVLARFAARQVHGPHAVDAQRERFAALREEIAQTDTQIELFRGNISVTERLLADAAPDEREGLTARLAEQQAALEDVKDQRRRLSGELEGVNAKLSGELTGVFGAPANLPASIAAEAVLPIPGLPARKPGVGGVGGDADADKRLAKARKQLAGIKDTVDEQVATFGEGRAAVLEYRLTLGDLADAVDALGPGGERLATQIIDQARALDELEAAKKADAAAQREREALKERGIALTERLQSAEQRYTAAIRRYLELLHAGAIDQQTFNRALAQSREDFEATREGAEVAATALDQFAVAAARGIQGALAEFLFEPFEQGLDGLVSSVAVTMQRIAAEIAAAQLAKKLFGAGLATGESSDLGGYAKIAADFAAELFHGGGVVGEGHAATRTIAAAAFAGAPHFGRGGIFGLGPEEMPAIVHRGEEVLRRDDPRHRYNAGAEARPVTEVTVNVQSPDAASFRRSSAAIARDARLGIARGAMR